MREDFSLRLSFGLKHMLIDPGTVASGGDWTTGGQNKGRMLWDRLGSQGAIPLSPNMGPELGTLELPPQKLSPNPPHIAAQLKCFNRMLKSFPIWLHPATPDGCLTVPHQCAHSAAPPSLYPHNCASMTSPHPYSPITLPHPCTPITSPHPYNLIITLPSFIPITVGPITAPP